MYIMYDASTQASISSLCKLEHKRKGRVERVKKSKKSIDCLSQREISRKANIWKTSEALQVLCIVYKATHNKILQCISLLTLMIV